MRVSVTDLRSICKRGAIRWTAHVLKRLMLRNITQDEVLQAIETGEIIEQYPEDYPFPSCLLLGMTIAGRYLHVVCGRGEQELWMITAYEPDPDEWESDWKTRKKGTP